MQQVQALVSIGIVFSLSGCAVGPDYERPEVDVGADWIGPTDAAAPVVDLETWWQTFDDPELDRLVTAAIAQNLDALEASARVAEARALRSAAAGGRWPVISARASVTDRRQSENGPIPINQIPGLDRDQTIYDTGFDALWEFDVFGRTARATEAASARVDAAMERESAVKLSVAAETARSYLELRGAQHERSALLSAIEASRGSTGLVRRRYEAGDVPEAALAQAEASHAALEAQLPLVDARVRVAALSIGILIGGLPEDEIALAESTTEFASLAPIPVGQRADLLRRRPDVQAAERLLAAATADVGVATAELFPKIGISANGGFQSLETGTLFDSSSETFGLTPLISWRFFDGGRVRAQISASEARVEVAALQYEKAVREALTDAEIALARYNSGLAALDRQNAAVTAARRSYGFASDRYRAGDISLLELLEAEQALRSAEDAYARTHTAAATGLVALFKALGGGWDPTS